MRKAVTALLLAALLYGCNAIRTVYNQAEHVAAWRADDYFDFTDEQKRMFRGSFERLHAWHRATQLKAYAGFLEAVDKRLARGPGMQDVAWIAAGVKDQSRTLILQGYKDASGLLSSLSDAQIAAARRKFERDNRKYAKEHGVGSAAPEQRRLRLRTETETIEHWTGPLDSHQRARVAALDETLPLDASMHHQDRLRRQHEFLVLLEQRHDARFDTRLRDWLLDWNAGRPAELAQRIKEYDEAKSRMLLTLYDELRPEQRRKVSERVRWYIDAMRDLSREASQQAEAASPLPATARP